MGAYEDLLEWSRDQAMWQRDALRRLAQGAVTGDHIRQLADLAVAETAGRADLPSTPLDATHLPASATPGREVRLICLSGLRSVNAIADGVDIPFGAVNDPAPAPDELANDLRVIEQWVQSFRDRRRR